MNDFFGLLNKTSDEDAREWLLDPKNMLYFELYLAELQARRGGKRKTVDAHSFEQNLAENLTRLRDALWGLEYRPSRGTAHIIFDPVQREIFAAPYVDRVVHHFIVNTLVEWWEARLSSNSFSCRVGKGTSAGIEKLRSDVQAVSDNYHREAFVIKLDISGYFMHIKRQVLYDRVIWGLDRQFAENYNKRYQILKHAISAVIFDDPVKGVKIQGSYEDWRGLPPDKSLFPQPPGQGMVIGNLTSQFFSNIYLDPLDRFVHFDLGYKHYGRYVDDFYLVVTKEQLPQAKRDIKAIAAFLESIGLSLNEKKTQVIRSYYGVPFLGMVVKNRSVLPGKRLNKNFLVSAQEFVSGTGSLESIVSYLGMLSHYDAKRATDQIFQKVGWEYRY